MKTEHWVATLAGIYGAGALSMYFFDPERGKRRRTLVKDSLVHSQHELQKFAGSFGRDLKNRIQGAVAETENLFHQENVSDYILEQRVRTAIGRVASHPHGIDVSCKDGSVVLTGWILADELEALEKAVAQVRGAAEISSFLHATDHPQHISDLQGGAKRRRLPEFLQQNWSPTTRVIAGTAGLAMITYGLLRRESAGLATGLGGAALLARSVMNVPVNRAVGIGKAPGVRIQKTMHIHAKAKDLYEFWANPENYPRVFTHIQKVTCEPDGTYRWHAAGPASIPLTWTGKITRKVPGSLVEWQSVEGSAIENHGFVRLDQEENGRTRVHVQMSYTPPAGLVGHTFAALLGLDPKSLMDEDFIRLKALFEQGFTRVRGHEILLPELKTSRTAS